MKSETGDRRPETGGRGRRVVLACVLAFSVSGIRYPVSGSWQCPDGAPPPCARAATPARAVQPPDPHRIAILPFRVTGADTSLGEGIAELLSAEFTGESGPRAVHMGTVIRAWRSAGGGARVPLTQPVAMRTARQMGAGYFVDGSIVGLGNRLTVTASVVSATDGQSRRAESIRGSADSLDVLLSRLTTTLLALAGGEPREGSRGVLTASPAAMRAYVEGMAEWRRARRQEANAAFERAFREDSSFARAALMRYWSANFSGDAASAQWAGAVFALRERLSSADRLLLYALLGERYPTVRRPAISFGDRERAAAQLPESPEAQYLAGDWLFHYGGAIDAADALERARGYFARSVALDSQQTVLGHLVDVATMLADSALLRNLQPALESRAADMQGANWLAAGYLGDRAWLARLRATEGARGVSLLEPLGLLPAAVADEMAFMVEKEVTTGDPMIDAAVLVKSDSPDVAREFFSDAGVSHWLRELNGCRKGWQLSLVVKGLPDVYQLTLTIPGVLSQAKELDAGRQLMEAAVGRLADRGLLAHDRKAAGSGRS